MARAHVRLDGPAPLAPLAPLGPAPFAMGGAANFRGRVRSVSEGEAVRDQHQVIFIPGGGFAAMPESGVPIEPAMEEAPAMPKPSVTLRDACSFIDDVAKYYNTDDLSDIILQVGEKEYPAHKFILGKSSEVFKSMLFQSHWTQSSMERVQLEEPEDVHDVFDRFLKFMYTSEVSVDADSVVPVLCLADKYCVAGLRNLCTSYMVEQAKSPHAKHAVNYYCFAKALCVNPLMDQCIRTNAWHAEALLKSQDWTEMEADLVEDILKSSELVLRNEMSVFNAVKEYVFHESHAEDRDALAKRLLPLVRFPQMLVQQLYEVETDSGAEYLTIPEVAPLLAELLARAYRFRALCPSRRQLAIEDFKEGFYQPRDYLDLCVDSINMANTLRFGIQVDVRMFSGPVPAEVRDAEWRVVYRRQNNNLWSVSFIPSESAMKNGNGEARIEASLIILDEKDVVVSLIRAGPVGCTRTTYLTIELDTASLPNAKTMQTIIKPTI